jgi:hypothetical protein
MQIPYSSQNRFIYLIKLTQRVHTALHSDIQMTCTNILTFDNNLYNHKY